MSFNDYWYSVPDILTKRFYHSVDYFMAEQLAIKLEATMRDGERCNDYDISNFITAIKTMLKNYETHGPEVSSFKSYLDSIFVKYIDSPGFAYGAIAGGLMMLPNDFNYISSSDIDDGYAYEYSYINLTPHDINIVNDDGDLIFTIPPCGEVARVSTRTEIVGYVDFDIPLTQTVFGEVEGLREPVKGVYQIVSSLVKQRCLDRDDVVIPNESVRDEHGRIIGCKSLGLM